MCICWLLKSYFLFLNSRLLKCFCDLFSPCPNECSSYYTDVLTHHFREKTSPSMQPAWSALQKRPWLEKTSSGAGHRAGYSRWEPSQESWLGQSWLMWGQCSGQMMSRKSQRRQKGWCPPSPLEIHLLVPWSKYENEENRVGKELKSDNRKNETWMKTGKEMDASKQKRLPN